VVIVGAIVFRSTHFRNFVGLVFLEGLLAHEKELAGLAPGQVTVVHELEPFFGAGDASKCRYFASVLIVNINIRQPTPPTGFCNLYAPSWVKRQIVF
jgi:hypothetical protein